jgi:DNA-binding LacI/PurR family transcriptional regulator
MNAKKGKRVTINDIAHQLGIAPSSVSKALNEHPFISERIKAMVKVKAQELNYVHNSQAANLRRGSSRTIGVIVPKINTTFFSDAIAGMEEACAENKHSLIICQSDESYSKEKEAVETLLHQNVDCIIISLSIETTSATHLQDITNQHVHLIQFDRVDETFPSHRIVNDNKNAAYRAVMHLIKMGYERIALLGGPNHLTIYKDRKQGFLQAMEEAQLNIPYNYVCNNILSTENGMRTALELLESKTPPDAFFAVSDYSALGAFKAAFSKGLKVPEQIGIMGFSNDTFTNLVTPALSSVDQKSRSLGKNAVKVYFDHILNGAPGKKFKSLVVESSVIIRDSSLKTGVPLHK